MPLRTDNFLTYRNYQWFWINACAVAVSAIWYLLDSPIGPKNGGTWFGYISGGVAAAGILVLMWYALRRRGYHARWTTLLGCLSVHAWLGLALLFLVPLHAGFEFGWNVHTLAYAVMVMVILSGAWGALRYLTVAPTIASHRGGAPVKALVAEVLNIDTELARLEAQAPQLSEFRKKLDFSFEPRYWRLVWGNDRVALNADQVSRHLADLPVDDRSRGLELVGLVDKKREFEQRLRAELRAITKLRLWLSIHLPLSLLLVALVSIHVFVVFYYRG